MHLLPDRRPGSRAFTLVELLVVIGIIALLISILLPALNKARAQANALKCATQLREIGNAFRYYSNDNRGYYPPAKLQPGGSDIYDLDGFQSKSGGNEFALYWYNFLNRYVTKNKLGNAGTGASGQDAKTRSVIWGCTNWDGYSPTAAAAAAGFTFNSLQTGYGMNAAPTNSATSTPGDIAQNGAWSASDPGKGFYKATMWGKNGAERMLVSESKYWITISWAPQTAARGGNLTYVGAQQGDAANSATVVENQSYVAFWRHGKLPANEDTSGNYKYAVWKGRIAYNILYCDGHVSTVTDWKEGFKAYRMKFPG